VGREERKLMGSGLLGECGREEKLGECGREEKLGISA